MKLSLSVNSYGYIYCAECRAPIFEKNKYVIVDGDDYLIRCFTTKVEQFLELLKEK